MNDFIAIDFETATEARESAISIGLVRYRNFRPIASYYSLIRPPKLYIHPGFTDIHGLTVEDVKDAPSFADIWGKVAKPFMKGSYRRASPVPAADGGFPQQAAGYEPLLFLTRSTMPVQARSRSRSVRQSTAFLWQCILPHLTWVCLGRFLNFMN